MLGFLKWLNPAYPISKLISPVIRRPEKAFALAGKPLASASSALMARNEETVALQLQGDVQGEITITVPYDQDTLEKILAVSLLPQVALLSTAYAIPELQRDLNVIWRTATLGKAGNLPRWNASRDLMGRRIKQEVLDEVAKKGAQQALARGATVKGASQVGARLAGSFVPFLNVVIWVDTGILALTGILDLAIDEENEPFDISPVSPLGEVIGALGGWVASTLGFDSSKLVEIGQSLGIDALAKGGLLLLGDLVLDTENANIDIALEAGDQIINLDLDGRTFGEVIGLALQFSALEGATSLEWDDHKGLFELFFYTLFSILLIYFGRQLLRVFRSAT